MGTVWCVGGDGGGGGGVYPPSVTLRVLKLWQRNLTVKKSVINPGMSPLRSAKEGCLGFPDFPKTLKLPKLTKKYPKPHD